jgi:hypothetical protein
MKEFVPIDPFFLDSNKEVEPDEFERIVDKNGRIIKKQGKNFKSKFF